MAATATFTPGKVVWREYCTRDVENAKSFYGGLFGWRYVLRPMGDRAYTLILVGELAVGGIMDLAHIPNGEQVPPHWGIYISVPDVDDTAEKAVAAGGKHLSGCQDIPGVGRFAVIQDPQGGVFNLFHAFEGDQPDAPADIGEFAFELLNATDPAAAVAYYSGVVGWAAAAMGPVTRLMRNGGEKFVAAVAPAPPGVPAHWMTHVRVADVAATNARARELGGEVLEERIEVPGYGFFALIKDPAGVYIMSYEATAGA